MSADDDNEKELSRVKRKSNPPPKLPLYSDEESLAAIRTVPHQTRPEKEIVDDFQTLPGVRTRHSLKYNRPATGSICESIPGKRKLQNT